MKTNIGLAVCLCLSVLACEKGSETGNKGEHSAASGPLTDSERALLVLLPADAKLVFGGNYEKLMKYWQTSPLRKLSESLIAMAGNANGMRDYMTCWMEQKNESTMAGAMDMGRGELGMTMVFRGVSASTLTTCAEKGGFSVKRDSDGKYLEIDGLPDGRGGTTAANYYFVDPQTLYFAMEMKVTVSPGPGTTLGRSQIEKRLADAAANPTIQQPEFMALIAKADRSKPIWFAGTTAGTPLARQLTGGSGWMDAEADSITLAFAVDLAEGDQAKAAVAQFEQVRGSASSLPAGLKEAAESFLESASLSASGNTLRGKFRLTNDMISKAMPAIQGLMGGFGR